MKLYKIFKAFPAMKKIYELNLSFYKAHLAIKMKNAAETEYIFYSEQEEKLINQFVLNEKAELKGKQIKFKTQKSIEEYLKLRKELQDTEIEWNFPVLHISDAEIGNQPISGESIDNLRDFITFGGD